MQASLICYVSPHLLGLMPWLDDFARHVFVFMTCLNLLLVSSLSRSISLSLSLSLSLSRSLSCIFMHAPWFDFHLFWVQANAYIGHSHAVRMATKVS